MQSKFWNRKLIFFHLHRLNFCLIADLLTSFKAKLFKVVLEFVIGNYSQTLISLIFSVGLVLIVDLVLESVRRFGLKG